MFDDSTLGTNVILGPTKKKKVSSGALNDEGENQLLELFRGRSLLQSDLETVNVSISVVDRQHLHLRCKEAWLTIDLNAVMW